MDLHPQPEEKSESTLRYVAMALALAVTASFACSTSAPDSARRPLDDRDIRVETPVAVSETGGSLR